MRKERFDFQNWVILIKHTWRIEGKSRTERTISGFKVKVKFNMLLIISILSLQLKPWHSRLFESKVKYSVKLYFGGNS